MAGGDNGLMTRRDWVEAEADFPAPIWRGSGRPPLPEVLVMAPPSAEIQNGRDRAGGGAGAPEGGRRIPDALSEVVEEAGVCGAVARPLPLGGAR